MKSIRFNKGEITLGYLIKLGGTAFLGFAINWAFDAVSGIVDVYRVATITSSPQVHAVKSCVYETIMDGSYSRLHQCSRDQEEYGGSSPAIEVRDNGIIVIRDHIEGASLRVKLTPQFRDNGTLAWECSGRPARFMPRYCTTET